MIYQIHPSRKGYDSNCTKVKKPIMTFHFPLAVRKGEHLVSCLFYRH